MAKFSGKDADRSAPLHANATTEQRTITFEGAPAYKPTMRAELFNLAVVNMVGQDTFYEGASDRDARFRALVHSVTKQDPEFVERLVPFLRNTAQMRSAPVVAAAEYALAGGPHRRQVINSAMSRADEPAEFIGYWIARTGSHTMPGGVQRGVADAVTRLYNEYAALKYDGGTRGVRMGDVIELTHPTPKAPWQAALFKWLLDQRHHNDGRATSATNMLKTRATLQGIDEKDRRNFVRKPEWSSYARDGGLTWEYLSGWLPGGMDAEAWESVIPEMGYMALLRNLRNFDKVSINEEATAYVLAVLQDPERVAKSRQFPYRFWTAYRELHTLRWGPVLERALDLSTQNIPKFDGSTLILIDMSASMTSLSYGYGRRRRGSTVPPSEIAALFAAATYKRNPDARVVGFGQDSMDITPKVKGGDTLKLMHTFGKNPGVGHATRLNAAFRSHYNGEDRVVVFTDMQTHDGGVGDGPRFVHYFQLGGYDAIPDQVGARGRYMYGGFTDATFRQMGLIEKGHNQRNWEALLGTPTWMAAE